MNGIKWYKELDSTNNEVKREIDFLDNFAVIATESQSAGRGQGSHSWFASPGLNLTFSILYRPASLPASQAIVLTHITTVALLHYLSAHGVQARVKWPNDIWVGEKKICGILIETVLDKTIIKDSIIGIGLNLGEKNWPKDLPNPVSLSELTGKEYNPKAELELFMEHFIKCATLSESEEGRQILKEAFEATLFRRPEEP